MANAAEKRPLDEHRARRLRKWVLRAGACLALLVVLGVVGAYVAGNWLTAPAYTAVGAPPGDTGWRDARFEDDTGVQLRGWFGEGEPGRGAIILLHSIRADRRQMLRRARFLQAKGLAVLLFDLQAHGESGGTAITFGVREARSAAAALEYVRKRLPEERVAVIGTSLGGAACLLGDGPVSADAMILEGVYSTVERAIENRLKMQFGRLGALGTPMASVRYNYAPWTRFAVSGALSSSWVALATSIRSPRKRGPSSMQLRSPRSCGWSRARAMWTSTTTRVASTSEGSWPSSESIWSRRGTLVLSSAQSADRLRTWAAAVRVVHRG
jgi:pimeloyl-ACP methyl ester carboxylesterase